MRSPTFAAVLIAVAAIPAAAQSFQPSKIVASRDSFDLVAQGRSVGHAIIQVGKDNPNVRIEASLILAGMGMQKDSIVFNGTTLTPVAAGQRMAMGPMSGSGLVTMTDGRLKGSAAKPGPGGVANVPIDVAYEAGSIADGSEIALFPTLDLNDTFKMSFKTFDPTSGELTTNEAAVKGKESVTVGAGTFEVYKLEVSGRQPAVFYLTTAQPRRLVMIAVPSQGLEIRLAK